MGIWVGMPRPALFGIEATEKFRSIRLFRNGHLEYSSDYWAGTAQNGAEGPIPVYSYPIAAMLMNFLEVARQTRQLGEISEPTAITTFWLNFRSSYLHWWRGDGVRASFIRLLVMGTAPNALCERMFYYLDRV